MRDPRGLDRNSLRFDVSSIVEAARRLPRPKINSVSLNLPFLTINVSASRSEKKIAREILIRLRDKRVLVAWECCDSCIDNAVKSIMEIRTLLVDKQVEIQDENSPLFLISDLMLTGIRQFLTFTEARDPLYYREEYFTALEALRGHLLRCIEQVGRLASVTPRLSNRLQFDREWAAGVYVLS